MEIPARARALVVDDDEQLLAVLAAYLRTSPWEIESHTSPMTAVTSFLANPGAYAIALLDLSLQEMSGDELAFQLNAVRPGMPIILLSGYQFDIESVSFGPTARVSFLLKPFTPAMLNAAIESA